MTLIMPFQCWNILIEGSHILADHGYDSNTLLDYIYDHGDKLTIPFAEATVRIKLTSSRVIVMDLDNTVIVGHR